MRYGLLNFSVFWLAECASAFPRRPSTVNFCRKAAPLASSSSDLHAKPDLAGGTKQYNDSFEHD